MKRTLFLLSLSLVSTAWADGTESSPTVTLDEKLYATRSATWGGVSFVEGQHYVEYHKVSGSGDFYLSSAITSEGEALDLSATNIWLANEGDSPLSLKEVKIENAATVSGGKTKTHYGILVEKGEVVIDDVETGDLQSNLSIGTTFGNQTATLTISGGSKVETTAYYNTIGANGSTGVLNVKDRGTVLSTQQITLGSSQCLTSHTSHIISENEMCYDGICMTVDERVVQEATADGASEGHGTINITEGAIMNVGDGNSENTSTNKLQIFNGELNISGADSKLYMHQGTYLTMDPNYGSQTQAPNVKVAINLTDGGKLLNSDGEKIAYFSLGYSYGQNSVDATISVAGTDSSVQLADSSGWYIDSAGSTVVEAKNGGTIELNSDSLGYIGSDNSGNGSSPSIVIKADSGSSVKLGGTKGVGVGCNKTYSGQVTLEATGKDSSLALASSAGGLYVNADSIDSLDVKINAKDGATVSLSAGGEDGIELNKNTEVEVQGEGTALKTHGVVTAADAKITIGSGATWESDSKIVLKGSTSLNNSGTLTATQLELGEGTVFDNNGKLSGTLTAGTGAKITGSGSFGTLVVQTGSTLVVGNSPGLQTVEALEIQTGSKTIFSVAGLELADVATATEKGWESGKYSSIVISESGALTLTNGASFTIAFGGGVFDETLLDDGAKSYTQQFNLLLIKNGVTLSDESLDTLMSNTTFTVSTEEGANPNNWSISVSEAQYRVENSNLYLSGTVTAIIPEPTTATLSLLALAGLAARRRRS